MSDSSKQKQLIPMAITLVAIICVWIGMIFVLPKLSIWSSGFDAKSDHYETVTADKDYSFYFNMPCRKLTSVKIELRDTNSSVDVTALDGEFLLKDNAGNIVKSFPVTSAYITEFKFSNLDVDYGEVYEFVFHLRSVPQDTSSVEVGCTDTGSLAFEIRGRNESGPDDYKFSVLYLLIAILVLLFVYTGTSNDLKAKERSGQVIFYAGVVLSVFFVSQFFDLFMISKAALRMIESIKAGEFFNYYNWSYDHELVQTSHTMYFGYNYSVLTILPFAILMIPFSFFTNGDLTTTVWQNTAVMYLTIIIAVLVVFSVKYTKKICEVCGMSEQYSENVKKGYAFSGVLLFITVATGQLDIMYVLLMLWAFLFYYAKKYKTFSLIMAFAVVMKLFPLMVFIPMILPTNKKIKDIILNGGICISVTLLVKVLFERGTGYSAIMAMMEQEYAFSDRLFDANVGGKIGFFVLFYALICIFCYMKKVDTENKKAMLYYSMFIMFAVYGSFMMFVAFHRQWLIPFVLSLAFLMACFDDVKLLMVNLVLEVLVMIASCIYGTSIYMSNYGVLTSSDYIYEGPSVESLFRYYFPMGTLIVHTLMAAVILYLMVYFAKPALKEKFPEDLSTEHVMDHEMVVGKIWVLYGVIAFFLWCYFYV